MIVGKGIWTIMKKELARFFKDGRMCLTTLLLMSLASKPLACPPFPLDKLEELAALSGVSMEG